MKKSPIRGGTGLEGKNQDNLTDRLLPRLRPNRKKLHGPTWVVGRIGRRPYPVAVWKLRPVPCSTGAAR
jgi:hypothetical protein